MHILNAGDGYIEQIVPLLYMDFTYCRPTNLRPMCCYHSVGLHSGVNLSGVQLKGVYPDILPLS